MSSEIFYHSIRCQRHPLTKFRPPLQPAIVRLSLRAGILAFTSYVCTKEESLPPTSKGSTLISNSYLVVLNSVRFTSFIVTGTLREVKPYLFFETYTLTGGHVGFSP